MASGVLLRNQVAAVLVAVGLVCIVDTLLSPALNGLGLDAVVRYTMNNASTAVLEGLRIFDLLPWWGGLLVLIGYTVVIAVAGWALAVRRDVG